MGRSIDSAMSFGQYCKEVEKWINTFICDITYFLSSPVVLFLNVFWFLKALICMTWTCALDTVNCNIILPPPPPPNPIFFREIYTRTWPNTNMNGEICFVGPPHRIVPSGSGVWLVWLADDQDLHNRSPVHRNLRGGEKDTTVFYGFSFSLLC